jgi:hypothetical protein
MKLVILGTSRFYRCIFEDRKTEPMPIKREPGLYLLTIKAAKALLYLFVFCIVPKLFAQDLGNLGDQKPVSLDGAITLSGTKYSISGAPARRPPTSWTIVGTPTLGIYGVSLPFTFILSDQESDFRQPFDQFGVSPTYKWATLHLGYNSLSYSKYTLAGITFLGAGLDLNPDPLRFSVMYGRFQRAVQWDTSVSSQSTYSPVQPAYERMGFAGKIGYGSQKSFIDFIYLHAADDSNSLARRPDSLSIFPQENTVFALNTHISIIDQLALEGEAAASFFTRDIRAPLFDSGNIPTSLQKFVTVHSSTNLLTAANAGLIFTIPHFTTRLGYERIEPEYNSLGAYYFTSDVENYTIAPAFDIFQNKIRVSGSVGIQNDNILNTKTAQTQRVIGSGNISINPAQVFGLDLSYTNYATTQGALKSPLDTGKYQVRNVSQSASVTPRLLFISSESTNSFILSISQQQYTDYSIYTSSSANSRTTTGSFNYNLSLLKTGLNAGASLLYANTTQASTTTALKGVTVNGSKAFFQNQLSLGGSLGFTQSQITIGAPVNLSYTTNTINESFNASFRVSTQGTFTLVIYATENTTTQSGTLPFTEITATLSYSHNFSF